VLKSCIKKKCLEAGLDEAGRGCLSGPVYAAAVILPPRFNHPLLRDSKTLNYNERQIIRGEIEKKAIAFAIGFVDELTIDRINILQASIQAMHNSISNLSVIPEHLAVDGNYFLPYNNIPFQTAIKGDNTYRNIAAASILAKTYRDDFMLSLHEQFPQYHWNYNKGYATKSHVDAIKKYGFSPYHRHSFRIKSLQLQLLEPTV